MFSDSLEAPVYTLSSPCQKMVELLLSSPASPMCLTRVIRSEVIQDFGYEFDLYLHWNLAFIENDRAKKLVHPKDQLGLCSLLCWQQQSHSSVVQAKQKRKKDTQKLYSNITQLVISIDARSQENVLLFVVRFVNLTIFFESIATINGSMVKKIYCVDFVAVLPSLFNWKAVVIETVKKSKEL
ncbi:hypothetical protein BCV71DRAFT_230486 [Rhizopus microsporus]|uniref:Uncharacterized protein n=1 Tax=Rhizopus microsporus TaxID=58291 RepID=A0A1X0SGD8_RHIZD|nr:hypothetical protein BCV71DRAFT_230486 [Rhizopus microsporus]